MFIFLSVYFLLYSSITSAWRWTDWTLLWHSIAILYRYFISNSYFLISGSKIWLNWLILFYHCFTISNVLSYFSSVAPKHMEVISVLQILQWHLFLLPFSIALSSFFIRRFPHSYLCYTSLFLYISWPKKIKAVKKFIAMHAKVVTVFWQNSG